MDYRITTSATEHLSFEDEMSERLHGLSDASRAVIALRPGMDEGWTRTILVHEILHQVFQHSGMTGLTSDDEEQIIRHLQSGVLGVLRDNPELVRYLTAAGG